MCMKEVQAQPRRQTSAMEPMSWPSCIQCRKPWVEIPTALSSEDDFLVSVSPPSSRSNGNAGDKAAQTLLSALERGLILQLRSQYEEAKLAAETSPRLAHDFPTPPLSPDATGEPKEAGYRDSEGRYDSGRFFWESSSDGDFSPFAELEREFANKLRILKLSAYVAGEMVRVRCNKSKWHTAEVVKVNDEAVRVWVAAAKSTVVVPVQLLETHLTKDNVGTPMTPLSSAQSPTSPAGSSPRSTTTTSSERSSARSFRETEPHAPSFVKSPVHAVRPAHLSHRLLFQQFPAPSAGACALCCLPVRKGTVLTSWGCGHKAHFACAESRFRQNLTECPTCADLDVSEDFESHSDSTDFGAPTFHCLCGHLCSLKDMDNDSTPGRPCCPSCQHDPWNIVSSCSSLRSTSGSISSSPRHSTLDRSSSGGFLDSDLAYAQARTSAAASASSSPVSSPFREVSVSPRSVPRKINRSRQEQEHVASPRSLQAGAGFHLGSRLRAGIPSNAGRRASFEDRMGTSRSAASAPRSESDIFRARIKLPAGEVRSDAVGALPVFQSLHKRRSTFASAADFESSAALVDEAADSAANKQQEQVLETMRLKRTGVPPRSVSMGGEGRHGSSTGVTNKAASRLAPLRRTVSLDTTDDTRSSRHLGKSSLSRPKSPPAAPIAQQHARSLSTPVVCSPAIGRELERLSSALKAAEAGFTSSPWAAEGQWVSVVKDGKDIRPRDLEFERIAAFKEGNLGKEGKETPKGKGKGEKWVAPLRQD